MIETDIYMENKPASNNVNHSQPDIYQQNPKSHLVLIILVVSAIVVIVLLSYVLFSKKNPSPSEKKISILCPSAKVFCQNKSEIDENGKAVGVGGLLKASTPVYAIVDGELITRTVTTRVNGKIEHYRKVTLKSKDGDLIAEYFFTKGKVKNSIVKKGDVIFVIESDEQIAYYQKYNLVFKLFDAQSRPILANEINFL